MWHIWPISFLLHGHENSGSSIYSFYTTYNSYQLLNQNTNNFNELIVNWQAAPLVDVQLLPSGSSCPSGYELGQAKYDDNTASTPQTIGQFPGSNTWCEVCFVGCQARSCAHEYLPPSPPPNYTHTATPYPVSVPPEWIQVDLHVQENSKVLVPNHLQYVCQVVQRRNVPIVNDRRERMHLHPVSLSEAASLTSGSIDILPSEDPPLPRLLVLCADHPPYHARTHARTHAHRKRASCNNVYSTTDSSKTVTYNTGSASCSTNATKAGCKTDTGLPKKALNTFGGKVVCYKRAAATSSVVQRPQLSATTCPSGSKTCGSGGYGGGQLCVPAGADCPVTFLSGGFNGTAALNMTTTGSTYRPIIEVRVTPGPG